MRRYLMPCSLLLALVLTANAQEKSVKPGINEPFKNPDVERFQKTFEGESREVFVPRAERAEREVFLTDLAKLQARRPDRPLQVGDLEVHDFVAP